MPPKTFWFYSISESLLNLFNICIFKTTYLCSSGSSKICFAKIHHYSRQSPSWMQFSWNGWNNEKKEGATINKKKSICTLFF